MNKFIKITFISYFFLLITYGINYQKNLENIKPSAYGKKHQNSSRVCNTCIYLMERLKKSNINYNIIRQLSYGCYSFSERNDIQDCLNMINIHIPHITEDLFKQYNCKKINLCK